MDVRELRRCFSPNRFKKRERASKRSERPFSLAGGQEEFQLPKPSKTPAKGASRAVGPVSESSRPGNIADSDKLYNCPDSQRVKTNKQTKIPLIQNTKHQNSALHFSDYLHFLCEKGKQFSRRNLAYKLDKKHHVGTELSVA